MKWSLLVGKFWGTEIRLHASMVLLIPYALFSFRPGGVGDALRVLLLIAAIFVCVALHEMGHTLAARLFGIHVNSIVLWPLGGFANLSRRADKVWHDLVILAAGPLTNLILFFGLAILTLSERLLESSRLLPEVSRFLWSIDFFPFLAGLTIVNLSLALFNLVPVYPLDGGQIARGILKLAFGEKVADGFMLIFSLPLTLGLTIFGIIAGDLVIILTGLLLMLAVSSLNVRLLNGLALIFYYFMDRGGYYLRRSDFDAAIRQFTRQITQNPNRAGPYVSRAVAHMNLMECSQAKSDVERALALDQNNFLAWALFGELLALEKEHDQALAAFNRAIAIRPNWPVGYLDRGGLRQEQGERTLAMEDMNRAVDLGQASVIANILRSVLRFQIGDLNGSRADSDLALRFAPHWMLVFPEVFLNNFKGHLNWALDYYWRAIERMPGAYQAYQGRADVCRINNRMDWALADYNRAIQLAPRQAELYLSRGRTFAMLAQPEKAAGDFHQAARLADRAHIRRQAEAFLKQVEPGGAPSSERAPNE